jgi:hypothetical protein
MKSFADHDDSDDCFNRPSNEKRQQVRKTDTSNAWPVTNRGRDSRCSLDGQYKLTVDQSDLALGFPKNLRSLWRFD